MKKSFNENMAAFFEKPTRNGLSEILMNNLGEQDNLDFKGEWPEFSKVAKHVLAFSNSGGGIMVVGVSENEGILSSVGVEELLDKSDIFNRIKKFLPSEIQFDVIDFVYNASEYEDLKGKKFQVLIVECDESHIPFVSKANGNGIKANVIYVRKGTSSLDADHEDIQKMINIRIGTQYSTSSKMELEDHISQLKVLFSHVDENKVTNQFSILNENFRKQLSQVFGYQKMGPNPLYPEENFEKFIVRMIQLKKDRIESLLH